MEDGVPARATVGRELAVENEAEALAELAVQSILIDLLLGNRQ